MKLFILIGALLTSQAASAASWRTYYVYHQSPYSARGTFDLKICNPSGNGRQFRSGQFECPDFENNGFLTQGPLFLDSTSVGEAIRNQLEQFNQTVPARINEMKEEIKRELRQELLNELRLNQQPTGTR